jgi:hypothetical protein
MGLDMYLTGRKFFWQNYDERDTERKEDGYHVESLDIRLGYWRKHPNLHGYMVKTFGHGEDDQKEIELTADDLRTIILAVKAKALPKTEGFFFGSSSGSDEERDEDLKILNEALTWLEATDPEPFEKDSRIDGPGFTAVVIKPDVAARRKPQNITRSVHYRGDW